MSIKKTIITVTVLHEDTETCDGMDLMALHQEMYDGLFIGGITGQTVEDVPDEKVQEELHAVGNDGKFFEEYATNQGGELPHA